MLYNLDFSGSSITPRKLRRFKIYLALRDATKRRRHATRYNSRYRKRVKEQETMTVPNIMTPENILNAIYSCRKSVSWKYTVQKNTDIAAELSVSICHDIITGNFGNDGFDKFYINERGKLRHIQSPTFKERVIQRILCEKALIPILSKSEIYDNGASLKGKGVDFSRKRLIYHMVKFYRNHGDSGWVLQTDFSKFFDNIDHEILLQILNKQIVNPQLKSMVYIFIKEYGVKGLGLGSQISQVLATCFPNILDHYIKDVLRCKYYGRYMDDSYQIYQTKEECENALNEMSRICKILHIQINYKKTKIYPITKGINFLKCKYKYINKNGKILRMGGRETAKRECRKIRKFRKIYDNGETTINKIVFVYCAYRGNFKHNFDSRFILRKLDDTFDHYFKDILGNSIRKLA